MENKELLVFVTLEVGDIRQLQIDPEATIGELVAIVHGVAVVEEEVFIFVEDEEEPVEHHRKIKNTGLKHGGHVHHAHCRHVDVFVRYNGQDKSERVAASTKLRKVREWAGSKEVFNIPRVDLAEKVFRLRGSEDELSLDVRVGSLARKECCVSLDLTDKVRPQG